MHTIFVVHQSYYYKDYSNINQLHIISSNNNIIPSATTTTATVQVDRKEFTSFTISSNKIKFLEHHTYHLINYVLYTYLLYPRRYILRVIIFLLLFNSMLRRQVRNNNRVSFYKFYYSFYLTLFLLIKISPPLFHFYFNLKLCTLMLLLLFLL